MTSTSGPAFGQLAQIIEDKLGIPRGSVRPDTRLKDLEIDSLSLIEVVLDVEEAHRVEQPGMTIPDR
jgi:acyl carrier protein